MVVHRVPAVAVFNGTGRLAGWHQAMWVAHVLSFLVFLAILPVTMLRHVFTSPLNMYLRIVSVPRAP